MGEMGSDRVSSPTSTFLFTDMEGSTSAWDRHGGSMAEAQIRHDAILSETITALGGTIFSTAGDGVAAVFSDPVCALRAAVDLQRKLAAEPWPEPVDIAVRMGLHTGQAIERDGDYFGP